jgi:hypothetical protein
MLQYKVILKALVITVLLVLCFADKSVGVIVNPGFEFEHDGLMPNGVSTSFTSSWGMPDDWSWSNSGSVNAHGTTSWSSEGDWSLYVFISSASHSPGDYIEFNQSVDLTDVTEIIFDVRLEGGEYSNSYFAIDSEKLWLSNEAGTLEVTLNTSDFSGVHEIKLGVEVFQSFDSTADGWTYFDNLRAVPEPGTVFLLSLGGLFVFRKR